MRGTSYSAAVLTFVIAALGWQLASPRWTLRAMEAAAAARDQRALAEHVDMPALRASLRAQFDAAGARGAAVAMQVERLAAPAAIARLIAPRPGDAAARIERSGLAGFRVTPPRDPAATLVFRRSGSAWKLAAMELPAWRLAAR